jgi:hypothetical protein
MEVFSQAAEGQQTSYLVMVCSVLGGCDGSGRANLHDLKVRLILVDVIETIVEIDALLNRHEL